MSRKSILAAAVALLAIAVLLALWLLPRDRGRSASPVSAEPVSADRASSVPQALPSEQLPTPGDAREVPAIEVPQLEPAAEDARTIQLLVLSQDDERPIAGARVTVYDEETAHAMSVGTETGAAGRCLLHVADGAESVRLRVEKKGFFHLNGHFQCRPEITLRMSPTSTLSGRVLAVDTGAPVPGARVRHLHGSCRNCEPDLTVADAGGNYELPGVPRSQTAAILLEAEGFAHQYRMLEIRGDEPEVRLDFRLERGFEITGRVVDSVSGAGLPDAKVGDWIRTDASGAFRGLVVRSEGEEAIHLRVEVEGHSMLSANLGREPGQDPFEFRLPRGAIVEGTVKNGAGLPIPGARVGLEKDHRAQALARLKGEPSPFGLPEGWSLDPEGYHCTTRTDEQGRFRIGNAVPWSNAMKLSIVAEGHARAMQEIQSIPGPGQSTRLEIVLEATQPEVTLRGEIWINGQSYGAAQGRVRWKGPSRQGEQEIYLGRFAANVEPGDLVLNVEVEGISTALDGLESRVRVDPGKRLDHVVDIRLPTRPIAGRVTFDDGGAAPRVLLVASLAVGGSGEGDRDSLRISTKSAEDGSYALEVPDLPGLYRLVASLDGDERSVEGVRPGADGVNLVMARGGVLLFRFRDARSDELLPGGGFELGWKRAAEEQYRSFRAGWPNLPDQDGWFELRLPAGRVDLCIRDPMRAAYASVDVEDVVIQPHQPCRLEFAMLAGQSVELVLAEDQEPLPERHTVLLVESALWEDVRYRPDRNSWDGGKLGGAILNRFVQFDRDRSATVRGLASGRYRFKVFPDDIELEPGEVVLGEQTSGPVLVRWRKR